LFGFGLVALRLDLSVDPREKNTGTSQPRRCTAAVPLRAARCPLEVNWGGNLLFTGRVGRTGFGGRSRRVIIGFIYQATAKEPDGVDDCV